LHWKTIVTAEQFEQDAQVIIADFHLDGKDTPIPSEGDTLSIIYAENHLAQGRITNTSKASIEIVIKTTAIVLDHVRTKIIDDQINYEYLVK
jgi:hypothetical protein